MIRTYARPRPTAENAASAHLFAVGLTVRMKSTLGLSPKTAETFQVLATLPPKNGSPQYRIRNDEEKHERVAMQEDLEAV